MIKHFKYEQKENLKLFEQKVKKKLLSFYNNLFINLHFIYTFYKVLTHLTSGYFGIISRNIHIFICSNHFFCYNKKNNLYIKY